MKNSMMGSKLFFLAGLLFFLAMTAAPAFAGIAYSVTDLTDTETNRYQITYSVNGFNSTMYAGFDIYFDDAMYSDITLIAQDTINWDEAYIFLADSIYGEGEDWALDAYALRSDESLSGWFTVSFYYTGEGLPGVQDIEYYNDTFEVATTGQTSAVPIPDAALLLLTGLAGILGFHKK